MKTTLSLLGKELQLFRYPKQQEVNLQAWDAADEYLIDYAESHISAHADPKICILNDDFGALGTWFSQYNTHWISDSYVAKQALMQNLEVNELASTSITCADSLEFPEMKLDWVLIKLPKSTALLEHQLIMLQKMLTPESVVVASGKVKSVHTSTIKLLEKHIGTTTTSLAKKKARLLFSSPSNKQSQNPYPTVWKMPSPEFTVSNYANVFSRQQLDIGARFMLQHLPDAREKTIIDLGCGNGVLGLHMLRQAPDCEVIFVDESHMAVSSSRLNVENNIDQGLNRSTFLHSNCLDEYKALGRKSGVDIVLCNPPFHQQNTITDHIAWQMFKDAKQTLNTGGELRIIGNRHLDYPQKLKRLFGGYKVIASDKKFSILSATKR